MNGSAESVYIVDDDPDARDSVQALVNSMGLRSEAFSSAEELLHTFNPQWRGCAVVDMRLPGISGLELQNRLFEADSCLQVVMISGHVGVPEAVQAIKNGAVTFIEKPYRSNELEGALSAQRSMLVVPQTRNERILEDLSDSYELLSPREKAVMRDVLADKPNRVIAGNLSISLRTVARLRAAVYDKFEVVSAMDLARLIAETGKPLNSLLWSQGDGESSPNCPEPA